MRTLLHSFYFLLIVTTFGYAEEDYSIEVNSLGIGNAWTSGVVTPLHVSVVSTISEPTSAWIQWEVPDADGDSVLWGKQITLSPNSTTSTWLYAPLQPRVSQSTTWNVRLRAWEENGPAAKLAEIRFSPTSIGSFAIDSTEGFIAVFGTRRLGLSGYQPHPSVDVKQEATIIKSGLQSADLPDAWPCFESLDAIVWADSPPEFTFRQEIAVEQWVERGGHLVISLPTIGDPWNLSSTNGPLSKLLGTVETTSEQIPIGYLDQILGRNRGWPTQDVTVRVFNMQNFANDNYYFPLLTLRNKRVIGVQKSIGYGTVTLVGVDLANGQLASLGLPTTDLFWNRIFGKRGDTPSQNTISILSEDGQLSNTIPKETTLPTGQLVAQEIAMSTTASGRLGTVLLLITSYWLLGGPIGYFILRSKKKQRWSWVVFSCVAAFFSVVSLGLSSTTSGVSTQLKHVTIIDSVFGETDERAIGWCSIYLPSFGITPIELGGTENNLLLPWSSPASSNTPTFVDHREIVVNLDHVPNQFQQPSRATTSNFAYGWLGNINQEPYNSIISVDKENPPVWLTNFNKNSVGKLTGSVVNATTKTIKDVRIIWVTDKQNNIPTLGRFQDNTIAPWINSTDSGQLLNLAYSSSMPMWEPDTSIDLAQLDTTGISLLDTAVKSRYQDETDSSFYSTSTVITKKEWKTKMEMLSLYSVLQPPIYQKNPKSKQGPKTHKTVRHGGRALDLAPWFGRPCIIVMGFIDEAPVPVPVIVDGEKVLDSTGETFVRWIYPLEESQ